MIRTTPFHARTSALNETGLWSHWSGHLAAEQYGLSDKFEYFAVRNAAGIFDTSPLFKYRISGPGAEAFLAGVLARDPRTLEPGHGQYAIWCDDRGYVVEDGVLLRHAKDEFVLTAAEPNLAYFQDLGTRRDKVTIEEVSEDWAVLSLQGPAGAAYPRGPRACASRALPYFGIMSGKIGGCPVTISRTGYTGDLGYEVWVKAENAAADVGRDLGGDPWVRRAAVRPPGAVHDPHRGGAAAARHRLREQPLRLDRRGPGDAPRARPRPGCSRASRPTNARSSAATRSGASSPARRPASGRPGIVVDWKDWDRIHDEAGLIPPKDHTPVQEEMFLYDADGGAGRLRDELHVLPGAPAAHRHRPGPVESAKPGSRVYLEVP